MKYSLLLLIWLTGASTFCASYKLSPVSIDNGGGNSTSSNYSAIINVKDIHGISTSKNYSAAYGYIPQIKNVNIETATLTMAVSPENSGTTTPTGETKMFSGQAQAITATPAASYLFEKWTANGLGTIDSPTSQETSVTVYGNVTVTANFLKASINITAPIGGEEWSLGSLQTITWSSENVETNVKIELLKGGAVYYIIAPSIENLHEYNWQIPAFLEAGSNYQIRVSAVGRPDINGVSASSFSIPYTQPTTLAVTSPNGGEVWKIGTEQYIMWTTDVKAGYLSIKLLKNGIFNSYISKSTLNQGSYHWEVPIDLSRANDYQILLEGHDFSLSDSSDGFFSLSTASSTDEKITVTAPKGGEVWAPGATNTISWSTENNVSATVNIELFQDEKAILTIASGTPNSGSYSWTIPESITPASNYRVKITSSSTFGFSPNYFSLTSLSSATLALAAQPSTGGSVTPADNITIDTGTAYSIEAKAANGFTFSHWAPSSNGRVSATFNSTTNCFIVGDATITAVFAEETQAKTATIKIKTNKLDKDSVDIKNALIDLSEFSIDTDTVSIKVDHKQFDLAPSEGVYAQKGTKQVYTYKTNKDITPKINFTLDLEKGTWKFKATKANNLLASIDPSDGVDFLITISRSSDTTYAYSNSMNLLMDETVKWTFNNTKDDFSTPTGNNFLISRMNGKTVTNKTNTDTFKITKATLDSSLSFDPENDSVMFIIDNTWFETISDWTQSGKNETFKWKGQLSNQTGTLSSTINITKGTWNFTLTKGDLSMLSAYDGLDIKLVLSTYTGEQTIYPAETITLKYKNK